MFHQWNTDDLLSCIVFTSAHVHAHAHAKIFANSKYTNCLLISTLPNSLTTTLNKLIPLELLHSHCRIIHKWKLFTKCNDLEQHSDV